MKLAFEANRVEVFRGLDREPHRNCNSLENEILICVSDTFNRLSSCHFFIVTISTYQNQLKIHTYAVSKCQCESSVKGHVIL